MDGSSYKRALSMTLVQGKLSHFDWLDMQCHPPLLQEERERWRSCGFLFDIAGCQLLQILADHVLIRAYGHRAIEADRAPLIPHTDCDAGIAPQILYFLRAARGTHDEGAILLEQIPDGRDLRAAIFVEGTDHSHMVFTEKLPGPIGKYACHRSISFFCFNCAIHDSSHGTRNKTTIRQAKPSLQPLFQRYAQQHFCWSHDPLWPLKWAHCLPNFREHAPPWLWFKRCQGFLKRRTPPGGEYFKGRKAEGKRNGLYLHLLEARLCEHTCKERCIRQ